MHAYNSAFLTLWSPQRFANVNALPPTHGSAENFSRDKVEGVMKSTQDHPCLKRYAENKSDEEKARS